jgi:UDP-N-acetylenolpyruvoylglucosamine reductase
MDRQSIDHLRGQVRGRVSLPGDGEYEHLRLGFNRSVDQHPALILAAGNAEDVAAGVRFAHDQRLGIAVKSTGHGQKYPGDGALLIVTTEMAAVQIDPTARTARVEAGAIWQQVVEPAAEYGLAPLLGTAPAVGVIGYTLGGGFGWLARRYGYATDSVRWIELVTADGRLRRISAREEAELFWGVRGGGGGFGVVTALEFDLYPVAKVYGGSLVYPGEVARDAVRFFRDWVQTTPQELTSSISIFKYPPAAFLPEEIRGKTQVVVRAVYTGDEKPGRSAMNAWLDWRTPDANTFCEMPFAAIGQVSNDRTEPVESYQANALFDNLPDAAIDQIVHAATDGGSPLFATEIRHAGGAIAQADPAICAMSHRDAQFCLIIVGIPFNPAMRAPIAAYQGQTLEALEPYTNKRVFANFMNRPEALDHVRDAYSPEAYARLVALKANVDPDNLFRFAYRFAPAA